MAPYWQRTARNLALVAVAGLGELPCRAATLAGDQACAACHADKVRSFHETAHAKTSRLPSAEVIRGSFRAGANLLETANPSLAFVMEAVDGGFQLTAHMRTSPTQELSRSEKIGIVVGSGRKGQTFLYWDDDRLFQLPVSYWTDVDGWVNSPGYVDGTADFDRPIVPRCLECHSSSFQNIPPPENRYVASSLVLGVSCERCHGPASEHVALMRGKGTAGAAGDGIVNPARLSRLRQLQVCALCHNGGGEPLAPALSYQAGDDLAKYIAFGRWNPREHVDVHARQVPLLEASRCFRSTKTMTCTTCHDVHTPQRDAASFVPKCLACHKPESCGEFAKSGHHIDSLCIDCHMPLQETGKIVSRVDGTTIRPKVRNHRIAIYPAEAAP
ncbi:MAG TPA: multiheme c-type cytochrome [Opitutaceae bacterium]